MKSLLFGLVLAMSAVLPATAANWVYIGSNNNGTTSHIDTESITDINGGYAYTEMMINETNNKYLVVRKEMLCTDRKTKINAYREHPLLEDIQNMEEYKRK